mmetsp:Transcript_26315/g.62602  ORF Transcript_26315/g.62602 Transcript_26315/m.62602 type:complete len:81 (+) Transcript_26315:39-281(+)
MMAIFFHCFANSHTSFITTMQQKDEETLNWRDQESIILSQYDDEVHLCTMYIDSSSIFSSNNTKILYEHNPTHDKNFQLP